MASLSRRAAGLILAQAFPSQCPSIISRPLDAGNIDVTVPAHTRRTASTLAGAGLMTQTRTMSSHRDKLPIPARVRTEDLRWP